MQISFSNYERHRRDPHVISAMSGRMLSSLQHQGIGKIGRPLVNLFLTEHIPGVTHELWIARPAPYLAERISNSKILYHWVIINTGSRTHTYTSTRTRTHKHTRKTSIQHTDIILAQKKDKIVRSARSHNFVLFF